MSNRKLLLVFTCTLLVVGGLLWSLMFVIAANRQFRPANSSPGAAPSSLPTASPNAALAPVTTHIDNPSNKLNRAKGFLEAPLSRDKIDSAKLILKNIPTSAAEYKEAQKLIRDAEAKLSAEEAAETVRLRGILEAEYQLILSEANPHLNYITTRLSKQKGGSALWGVHAYFTQYTFSIGGDAKVVSAWIDRNRNQLKKAGIVRVGVRSSEGWGGSCWFDV